VWGEGASAPTLAALSALDAPDEHEEIRIDREQPGPCCFNEVLPVIRSC
jgi:hypothetical protein